MPDPKQPFDVALSFKWADQHVAQRLYEALSPSLDVFYIARKQDDVASRDGVKAMREPFLTARLSVVLYRPPWGEDGWTETERGGIYDGCLAKGRGWKHLMVVNMDPAQPPPDTVPNHRMRFNLGEFSIDELIGAIKSTVLELGGTLQPITVAKQAEIHKSNVEFERARKQFRSTPAGFTVFQRELAHLFHLIEEKAQTLKASAIFIEEMHNAGRCVIRNEIASMAIFCRFSGYGSIEYETLTVEEFKGQILLPGERRMYLDGRGPSPSHASHYEMELSRSREPVWKTKASDGFQSTAALANEITIRFLKLTDEVNEKRNRPPRR